MSLGRQIVAFNGCGATGEMLRRGVVTRDSFTGIRRLACVARLGLRDMATFPCVVWLLARLQVVESPLVRAWLRSSPCRELLVDVVRHTDHPPAVA